MLKVILRQKAIDDLNDIWEYTFEKWSEQQADKYYTSIKIACNVIGEYPNIGKEYVGISNSLLGFKSGKRIIFYQIISTKRIEVIRILHERMDLKNRLAE
ncbi:MAG: type II toxin-antitoxin system RelE/ParE family toxin [Bacteroidota bacterium]